MKTIMSQTMLKYLFALAFSFFLLQDTKAQQDDWSQLADTSGVGIYFKTSVCNNVETLILKISNTNNHSVMINWSTWGFGPNQNIEIPANSTISGNCNSINQLNIIIPFGTTVATLQQNFKISSIISNDN